MSVDIVVPVYGAAEDLALCLASVAAETDLRRHGVILVIDGPQDEGVERAIAAFPAARVLRNERRLGFVQSVNRGMLASQRDVILLNSDTIVTPRWVEKLVEAAASSSAIGTVTPLSNHATLCSVPRAFEENLLPVGHDARSFATLVERVSARERPRIPTGVGVCLFIKRALIEQIGVFDAEHFGLGYGEENDFCMRASVRGWVHIADDATFIQHAGHRSFRSERASLQRAARQTLERLHPGYMPAIARFMRDDPLAPVRERILRALHEPRGRRVVHVVHGWPPFQNAGTELYARWLVQRQLQWRDVSVFTRFDDPSRAQGEALELMDGGARVRLVTNNFTQRNPLARNAIHDPLFTRAFSKFLDEEQPELVHIHHLAGHAFSLARVARKKRIPIVQQLQDWWPLCAQVNLLHRDGYRCAGPSLEKCARCVTLTRVPFGNRLLHLVRRWAARRSLACADAYVMGSEFIRNSYRDLHPATVIPYGIDRVPERGPRRAGRPLRFGFIGTALPHKGLHVAQAAFVGIDPAHATLTVHSGFSEEQKDDAFASMDVLLVPSIGLESFGLAAREAMARGVPVIATRDGALTEIALAEHFPSGDSGALREIVLRLTAERVDAWSRELGPQVSMDAHARAIEELYERVLEGRR